MGPRLGREGFFHEGQEVEVLLALAVGRLEDRVVESNARVLLERPYTILLACGVTR